MHAILRLVELIVAKWLSPVVDLGDHVLTNRRKFGSRFNQLEFRVLTADLQRSIDQCG